MPLPSSHNHVSERETGHYWPDGRWDNASWEDCLWCSAIEWLRQVYSLDIPASHAEAEKLRAASGEPPYGGSNVDDLKAGISRRYRFYGYSTQLSFASLWAALTPGKVAVVQGSSGALGSHYRRWSPSYAGGHAACVYRLDSTANVWWCDPLAPDNGYKGEWMSKDRLRLFVNGQPGARHLVGTVKKPLTWKAFVYPRPWEKTRKYFEYTVRDGYIVNRRTDSTTGFSMTCSAPRTYPNRDRDIRGSSYSLVKLRNGVYIDSAFAKKV